MYGVNTRSCTVYMYGYGQPYNSVSLPSINNATGTASPECQRLLLCVAVYCTTAMVLTHAQAVLLCVVAVY